MLDKQPALAKLVNRKACALQELDAGEDLYAKGASLWRGCLRNQPKTECWNKKRHPLFYNVSPILFTGKESDII